MTENKEFAEIEVVVTAEITYTYDGKELEGLAGNGLLPNTPEELADFKRNVANDVTSEIILHLAADHVSVTDVQYFEKEKGEPTDAAEEGEA